MQARVLGDDNCTLLLQSDGGVVRHSCCLAWPSSTGAGKGSPGLRGGTLGLGGGWISASSVMEIWGWPGRRVLLAAVWFSALAEDIEAVLELAFKREGRISHHEAWVWRAAISPLRKILFLALLFVKKTKLPLEYKRCSVL